MAVFDRDLQRIVVRIVYDGPANAGKTTNLAQLCRFFTTMRRGELVSFEQTAGRTLFFEWLHLDGGLVGGHPLRCQLLTVPGQAVLSHRRRYLLRGADAVVFVSDSSPASFDIGRRMLQFRLAPESAGLPLIVQANKQDLPGAQEPSAVRDALGLPQGVPIVGARAQDGVGVRETLVLAIREAANRVQRDMLARGIDSLVGEATTSTKLRHAVEFEAGEAPAAGSVVDSLSEVRDEAVALPAASDSGPVPSEGVAPVFPQPDVPTGSVWPAASGRDILRLVCQTSPVHRGDLVGQVGTADGSGASDSLIFEADGWCLKTSQRRRFEDPEAGRSALVHLARRKCQLGESLSPRTVLCLQPDPSGGVWLWTVSPWMKTLRTWMTEAEAEGNASSLDTALTVFAEALLRTVNMAARTGVVLDAHPSNFALCDGRLTYLDDDILPGRRTPAIGHSMLRRVDEYSRWRGALESYVGILEYALRSDVSRDDVNAVGLRESIATAMVTSDAGQKAKDRLLRALDGRRGA